MQTNQLPEKECAEILLYMQKLQASTLCSATLESANEQLRSHIANLLNKTIQNQKTIFDFMSRKGWYKISSAPIEEFNRISQTISTMQS